jgi:hypothetical protein
VAGAGQLDQAGTRGMVDDGAGQAVDDQPVLAAEDHCRRGLHLAQGVAQVHLRHRLGAVAADAGRGGDEQGAGGLDVRLRRGPAERAPHEHAAQPGVHHQPVDRLAPQDDPPEAVPAPTGEAVGGGGHQHEAPNPLLGQQGMTARARHHAHAAHGVTGEHRVAQVELLDHGGQVVAQPVDRDRVAPTLEAPWPRWS